MLLVFKQFNIYLFQYWMYKFRDTSKADYDLNNKTVLQQNFMSLSAVVSTVPGMLSNVLATRYGHKINIKTRLLTTSFIVLFFFLVFTAFIKIDTDSCKYHNEEQTYGTHLLFSLYLFIIWMVSVKDSTFKWQIATFYEKINNNVIFCNPNSIQIISLNMLGDPPAIQNNLNEWEINESSSDCREANRCPVDTWFI